MTLKENEMRSASTLRQARRKEQQIDYIAEYDVL